MKSKTHIIVYILTSKPSAEKVKHLISLFSQPSFKVIPINIPAPVGLYKTDLISTKKIIEAHRITHVLNHCYENYPNDYSLVLKDNSVTHVSSQDISNKLLKVIHQEKKWDLCYLCRWLDRCDLYKKDKEYNYTRTYSPHGFQAIFFSPSGRNMIIGKQPMRNGNYFTPIIRPVGVQLNICIGEKAIIAYCFTPNLFDYNVLEATGIIDLAKFSSCRRPEFNGKKEYGLFSFILFLAIIVIIIVIIWIFSSFMKDN